MHKLFAKIVKKGVRTKIPKREKREKRLSPEEEYENCPVCKRKMKKVVNYKEWPRRCEHCRLTITEPIYI